MLKHDRLGGVERSETALNLSAQRRANAGDRKFGRSNHQFVRQAQHAKVVFAQPGVSLAVLRLLVRVVVAWSVDLDDQTSLEANEIDNEIADRDLPTKFGAPSHADPEMRQKDRLRFSNRLRGLLAGEAKENGTLAHQRACSDACASRQIPQGSKPSRSLDTPHLSCSA